MGDFSSSSILTRSFPGAELRSQRRRKMNMILCERAGRGAGEGKNLNLFIGAKEHGGERGEMERGKRGRKKRGGGGSETSSVHTHPASSQILLLPPAVCSEENRKGGEKRAREKRRHFQKAIFSPSCVHTASTYYILDTTLRRRSYSCYSLVCRLLLLLLLPSPSRPLLLPKGFYFFFLRLTALHAFRLA